MICPKCGVENMDGANFCKDCGETIVINAQGYGVPPMNQPPLNNPQPMNIQQEDMLPVMPPNYQQPYQYPVYAPVKNGYSWRNVCGIVGFISSIVGVVTFWLVLCPMGLICSILGFKAEKTKGLAVAGIIIAILAIAIKLGIILYDLDILPWWLTSGAFSNH